MMKHVLHDWTSHKNDDGPDRMNNCPICNSGLASCVVCGGAESCMPRDCPGRRMTEEEKNAVTAGNLDFRDGQWWDHGGLEAK